jgi:pantothenate kinase
VPAHIARPADPVDAIRLMAARSRSSHSMRAPGRVIVGLAGLPGSGKSTLARALVEALGSGPAPIDAVYIPMDGFHLSNAELGRRGLSDVKGAAETFDVAGYATLLARLRAGTGVVEAPEYDRDLHEPVPDRIVVPSACAVVVTEGNYLGFPGPEWSRVRGQLDALWFVDASWDAVRPRLIDRHMAGGRARDDAEAWTDTVDAANAAFIAPTAIRADGLLTNADGRWRLA